MEIARFVGGIVHRGALRIGLVSPPPAALANGDVLLECVRSDFDEERVKEQILQDWAALRSLIDNAIGKVPNVKDRENLALFSATYERSDIELRKKMAVASEDLVKFVSLAVKAYAAKGLDVHTHQKMHELLVKEDGVAAYLAVVDRVMDNLLNVLIEFHKSLIRRNVGKLLNDLLEQKETAERAMQDAVEKRLIHRMHVSVAAGEVRQFEFDEEYYDGKLMGINASRAALQAELGDLKSQVKTRQDELHKYRNTRDTHHIRVFWFTIGVETREQDNGQRLAESNLEWLLGRIKEVETRLASSQELDDTVRKDKHREAKRNFAAATESLAALKLDTTFDDNVTKAKDVVKAKEIELKKLYKEMGTTDADAIRTVDILAAGVAASFGAVKKSGACLAGWGRNLKGLDADSMPQAVLGALRIICLADKMAPEQDVLRTLYTVCRQTSGNDWRISAQAIQRYDAGGRGRVGAE